MIRLHVLVTLTPLCVSAIILSGKCPQVPKTMLFESRLGLPGIHDQIFQVILLGAPFAPQESSYLFVEKNQKRNRSIIVTNDSVTCIQVNFNLLNEPYSVNCYFQERHVMRGGVPDKTLLIKSRIEQSVNCRMKPIIEEIRYWHEQGIFILWSCKDHPDSDDHDEAAMVVLMTNMSSDYIKENRRAFKNIYYKYLSHSPLFSDEDWESLSHFEVPEAPNVWKEPYEGLFRCPSHSWWSWIWISAIFIAVLALNNKLSCKRFKRCRHAMVQPVT